MCEFCIVRFIKSFLHGLQFSRYLLQELLYHADLEFSVSSRKPR